MHLVGRWTLWIFLTALSTFISVTSTFSQTDKAIANLQNQLNSWNQMASIKQSHYAFSLLRVTDGKPLLNVNSEKLMVPASNLKLITTATALQLLGPEYRFKTGLYYTGTIDASGTLQGSIHIFGAGDPTLGSEKFSIPKLPDILSSWCKQIAALGIKNISGSVVADAGIFGYSQVPDTWWWGDIGNYYGAPPSGLNISDNTYKITFVPGMHIGAPAVIKNTDPVIENLTIQNFVTTGAEGSGDNAYIYGAPYSYHRYVTGTVPKGPLTFSIKGSMPEPALYLANKLTQALSSSNIPISGIATADYNPFKKDSAHFIYEIQSPSLSEIITQTNLNSINLYADAIFKTLGVELSSSANADTITKSISKYWARQGLSLSGLTMADGSGLSYLNGVSTGHLSQLLILVTKLPGFDVFYKSMPVAGESGTLKNFCKGTLAAGKIRAKTGTQSKVMCYSGYITGRNNTLYGFSLMVNGYSGDIKALRREIEKLFIQAASLE